MPTYLEYIVRVLTDEKGPLSRQKLKEKTREWNEQTKLASKSTFERSFRAALKKGVEEEVLKQTAQTFSLVAARSPKTGKQETETKKTKKKKKKETHTDEASVVPKVSPGGIVSHHDTTTGRQFQGKLMAIHNTGAVKQIAHGSTTYNFNKKGGLTVVQGVFGFSFPS